MTTLCLVCTASCDGKLRNGVVACQACKSFFLRYLPDGEGLKCATSKNDCSVATNTQSIADGRRFRFVCPKCRFRHCQEVGMKAPKSNIIIKQQIMKGKSSSNNCSLLSQIAVGTSTKETFNSLTKVFMDINNATASTIPGLVKEWKPQVSNGEVTQSFLNNADDVSRLFAFFLKNNPFYNQVTMADRCSMF